MGPDGLLRSVPGLKLGCEPAEVRGQVFHLVELFLVGLKAALNAAVPLRVVGAVVVVRQAQLANACGKLSQELWAIVGLHRLHGKGKAGHKVLQEAPSRGAGQVRREGNDPFPGEVVDSAKLVDLLAVTLFAVIL